jgi:hypothetical protein
MTEAEWLACDDPGLLLGAIRDSCSERKLRLLACACCRSIWDLLSEPESRLAIELLEAVVDQPGGRGDVTEAAILASQAQDRLYRDPAEQSTYSRCLAAAEAAVNACSHHFVGDGLATVLYYHRRARVLSVFQVSIEASVEAREKAIQVNLVREIFGNPFRAVGFDPGWRTADVLSLATAAYDDRAFDRLRILSDALEEAGCTDDALLSHLRSPCLHVRGCWAVDLILGLS